MKTFNKAQGEIFGIALLFVIIILGILIYGKIQALNPNNEINELKESQYKTLSEGMLNSILKMSTGCYVERDNDKLIDLINFCIENSITPKDDPKIDCKDVGEVKSCSYAINLINSSLFGFLNSSGNTSVIGPIPFKLIVTLPSEKDNILNKNYTNFGQFKFKNKILVEKNPIKPNEITYRKAGFNRAPSGIRGWSTAKRNIDFELYLYFR